MSGVIPSRHRGLTLIEVLLSIVLLGVLVGSGASVLRDIQSSAGPTEDDPSADALELGLLADRFMDEPASFGVESLADLESTQQIPWRDGSDRGVIEVEPLRANNASKEINHYWILFKWNKITLVRWAELPVDEDTGGTGP